MSAVLRNSPACSEMTAWTAPHRAQLLPLAARLLLLGPLLPACRCLQVEAQVDAVSTVQKRAGCLQKVVYVR